jgi:hypothetical protein
MMSDPQNNDRAGKRRAYLGLLLGVPLLLFGLWLAASTYPGFYSGRRGPPPAVKFLIIPGVALATAGGYLIFKAR